ncbi:hypothetical protein llap_20015 [Limosa lapponica baueri]|uniref:Uncharacterized protein n=1 Tax=Limosa lapponica baueri TaxID=1758121 RepID=A0A2I0T796_LIMLA|nr:hypothetical protein llap_20015 [Limosa lapponica baueri]
MRTSEELRATHSCLGTGETWAELPFPTWKPKVMLELWVKDAGNGLNRGMCLQEVPAIETNETLKMEIKPGTSLYASSKQLHHLLYLKAGGGSLASQVLPAPSSSPPAKTLMYQPIPQPN